MPYTKEDERGLSFGAIGILKASNVNASHMCKRPPRTITVQISSDQWLVIGHKSWIYKDPK
jgi:hypothetical protein